MKTNSIKKRINNLLILTYCALLVFGQIPSLIGQFVGFSLKLSDVVLVALLLINITEIRVFRPLIPLVFSSFVALLFFPLDKLLPGISYLFRVGAILVLGRVLYLNPDFISRKRIVEVLLLILGCIALVGWFQYVLIPDLRALAVLGWDDHYFRLTSTYLDPAFTGIMMVFGVLLPLIHAKLKNRYLISAFFFITLLFTYSRASFLSLAVGLVVLYYKKISFTKIIIVLMSFFVILMLLPRPGGEGVKLERLYSIVYKAQNASFGFELIKKSPLFGFGYNNTCIVSTMFSPTIRPEAHSCSGLDNSVETLFLSFGIVGVMVLIFQLVHFYKKHPEVNVGFPILAAFFTHAQFTNTLFYQYCLGFVVIYTVVGLMKKDQGV